MKLINTPKLFVWRGVDEEGLRINGQLFGFCIDDIKKELIIRNIKIIGIQQKSYKHYPKVWHSKQDDVVIFTQHLSTLINTGIPLIKALEITISGNRSLSFRELIHIIKYDLKDGKSFSDALARHPNYFNDSYIQLIKVGEISGKLGLMLTRLAGLTKRSRTLKKSLTAALYYPILVISFSGLTSIMLLAFVLPKFETLFNSFGSSLPLLTRAIITLSHFVVQHYLLILIILSSLFFSALYCWRHSTFFKQRVEIILSLTPIIGKLIQKTILVKVFYAMATALNSGVTLKETLQSATKIVNHSLYQKAFLQMEKRISQGQPIHKALHTTQLFPNRVVQLVTIGEESGTLGKMLEELACYYEEDIKNTISNLNSLIDPIIMIILGTLIGVFVLAMYLPIFKLGTII